MDLNILGLHIHELRNQCRYLEANIGVFNQMLEKRSSVGSFFALQGMMTGATTISRLIWTPRKKGKERAQALRKMLDLPEKHPLNNPSIFGLLEQYDEVSDQWIAQSRNQYILYDFIGEIEKSQHKEVETRNIFRAYDPVTHTYIFRGKAYNLNALLKALGNVADRVNQVHMKLFPEQWKEVDDNGQPVNASDKEDAENSARAVEAIQARQEETEKAKSSDDKAPKEASPKKKDAPKKATAKKAPAKKATAKKAAPKKKAAAKKD